MKESESKEKQNAAGRDAPKRPSVSKEKFSAIAAALLFTKVTPKQ